MGCAKVIFTLEIRNEPDAVAVSNDVIMHIHFDRVSGVMSAGSMFESRMHFGLGWGGVAARGLVSAAMCVGGLI